MITTNKKTTLQFQGRLKPYLKDNISILNLSVYSKVVDRAIIVKNANEELYQYREQQRKRNRSDGAHGNKLQKKKKFTSTDNQNKEKTVQNSNVIYLTCGKKHRGRSFYKETGACFSCGT